MLKELAPGLKLGEESGQVHAHVPCAEAGEFSRALLEQRATLLRRFRATDDETPPRPRSGRGEISCRRLGLEPHGFQDFMRFEEYPGVEQVNPFFGRRVRHGSSALKQEILLNGLPQHAVALRPLVRRCLGQRHWPWSCFPQRGKSVANQVAAYLFSPCKPLTRQGKKFNDHGTVGQVGRERPVFPSDLGVWLRPPRRRWGRHQARSLSNIAVQIVARANITVGWPPMTPGSRQGTASSHGLKNFDVTVFTQNFDGDN